ncbi:hypothetical protein BDR04DRAFT_1112130 [Suillus decipiens]|nr:hypothetical protein BDR04DRAFT_1112130 [Suillus decipiens]
MRFPIVLAAVIATLTSSIFARPADTTDADAEDFEVCPIFCVRQSNCQKCPTCRSSIFVSNATGSHISHQSSTIDSTTRELVFKILHLSLRCHFLEWETRIQMLKTMSKET